MNFLLMYRVAHKFNSYRYYMIVQCLLKTYWNTTLNLLIEGCEETQPEQTSSYDRVLGIFNSHVVVFGAYICTGRPTECSR